MGAIQHLIAGAQVGVTDQSQHFVGAVTADDARRIEPVNLGDRLAQRRSTSIRIKMQPRRGRAIRLKCSRARSDGRFVGGELMGSRRRLRPRANIGGDIEYARFWRRTTHGALSRQLHAWVLLGTDAAKSKSSG